MFLFNRKLTSNRFGEFRRDGVSNLTVDGGKGTAKAIIVRKTLDGGKFAPSHAAHCIGMWQYHYPATIITSGRNRRSRCVRIKFSMPKITIEIQLVL